MYNTTMNTDDSKNKLSIVNNHISNLELIIEELKPALQAHPIPQSDIRSKGLVFELKKSNLTTILQGFPALKGLIEQSISEKYSYVLSINQTPPTDNRDFFMRPHLDLKWENDGFSKISPLKTTVYFLEFPDNSLGGELIVWENADQQLIEKLSNMDRRNVRDKISHIEATFIHPIPGRTCKFSGNLPHAVMGYHSNENDKWRLNIILAEFPEK
jgi:hypothetical protein